MRPPLTPITAPGLSDLVQGVGQGRPEAFLGWGLRSLLVGVPPQLFPAPRPQELLLAPALLEQLTCTRGSGELGRILTVSQGQQTALQGYRDAVCSGQAAARAQRFSGLAAELHNQLDVAKIAQQVRACLPAGPMRPPPGLEEMLGLLGPKAASGVCLWLGVPRTPSELCPMSSPSLFPSP